MLHLEIITERLESESNVELITTVPNVTYDIYLKQRRETHPPQPADMPDPGRIGPNSRTRGSRPTSWCPPSIGKRS